MNKNFICASTTPCSFDNHVSAPYLRRSFTVDGGVESAVISVASPAFYMLFINGRNITRGLLSPYISNPDDICYYDSYDIKDYLVTGENVIGLLLGNGFCNPFGGFVWDFDKAEFLAPPSVAVECDIATEQGRIYFDAASGFKTHPSPILFDELRHGEIYDARREIPHWNEAGFDDSGWQDAYTARTPRGELTLSAVPPIRKMREIKPIKITPQNGGYLYDFGINTAGLCRLTIDAQDGQEIIMRHGEILTDGEFYDVNIGFNSKGKYPIYDEYGQCVRYTARAGRQSYTPHFCYMGFRYVLVRGITEAQATDSLLTMLIYHSNIPRLASFECSNARTNRLFDMAVNSDLSNFYHFPTDCPHREKNGWTGDASMSADRMTMFYGVDDSFDQWLDNIRKAQRADGALPGIVPTGGWGFSWGNGPAWDSVLFNLPYQLFKQRGDIEVVRKNKSAQIKYLKYIMSKRADDGTVGIGLADWAPVDKSPRETTTSNRFTDSIMVMDMAKKAHEMYLTIGAEAEARYALGIYEEMRSTVRAVLIDPVTKTADGDNQTCQAMALYYGVFERDEENEAFSRLLELIRKNHGRFDCGFLGQHVLFHVLSRFGCSELAYSMITAPGFPSFGDLLDRGETAVVEHMWSDSPTRSSHNHHFQSEYARWFITDVAGIEVIDHKTVRIRPAFIRSLDFARAHITLPAGRVEIKWVRKNGRTETRVSAPDGITVL